MRPRFTLARAFLLLSAVLAAVLGGLVYVVGTASRAAVADSAAVQRDAASDQVRARVAAYLGQADAVVDALGARLRARSCPLDQAAAIESCLFAAAVANPNLSEVTFTHAVRTGFAADGAPQLVAEDRWQVSVYRDRAGDGGQLCTRRTWADAGQFTATVRCRDPSRALLAAPPEQPVGAPVPDPAEHPSFVTPASRDLSGQIVRTDLSYAELDAALPESDRRVVVTAMQAIEQSEKRGGDPAGSAGGAGGEAPRGIEQGGALLGVVRAGLLARHIADEVAAIRVNHDPDDPFRIFLCDADGRLVTPLSSGDRVATAGDDLRIAPDRVPPMIALALRDPALGRAADSGGPALGRFELDGRAHDVSFRPLAGTQGWLVGIAGPEDYYLRPLRDTLRRLLALTLGVIVLALAGGALTVRAVRRGLHQITRQAARLQAFDFAPAPPRTAFRDVADVLDSVEQAKTAMRAMRKYVPVDLVRELYQSNREPALGGRLEDLSILFTDVRGFTSLAETLEPDRLARLLGHYFSAMTAGVHDAHGTVDKYIGDAVMAMWNAPRPCADHPIAACRAALACVARTRALFASGAWEGLPALVTRFGIHRDRVMVGHFGAPDRFSFTAIGDGVNLAARLEGLNKLYGTAILVSDAIERDARGEFAFRRVDRVAVKGKSIGVEVYELIGEHDADPARLAAAQSYERALDAYFARDFDRALAGLGERADLADDGPARVLAARCEALRRAPPPPDWDGTFAATEK
jgi:adenylate cyclase